MTAYHDGRRIEYAVAHDLTDNGYKIVRASSSKGFADVVGIKIGEMAIINVKRTTMPGPAERAVILEIASMIPGILPLVALKPLRKPLEYRRLTGPGPQDWVPWTPDQIGRPVEKTT